MRRGVEEAIDRQRVELVKAFSFGREGGGAGVPVSSSEEEGSRWLGRVKEGGAGDELAAAKDRAMAAS
jgi:hypothetical protein